VSADPDVVAAVGAALRADADPVVAPGRQDDDRPSALSRREATKLLG